MSKFETEHEKSGEKNLLDTGAGLDEWFQSPQDYQQNSGFFSMSAYLHA